MSKVYVLMGVSGCGKTTVGEALAAKLGCPFFDGDDFHPPENVEKMANGIPLNDDDRYPWLARLHALIAEHLARGETAVLACSALKKKYRDQLREGNDGIRIVYLEGSYDLIRLRMSERQAHFMKANMLQSQFETLETPSSQNTLIIHIGQSVETVVADILKQIKHELNI